MEVTVIAKVRRKNQVTWPDDIARVMDVQVGSRLLIVFDEERGEARVRALRDSYAGVLQGVYGTPEEVAHYLEEERRSWVAP